MTGCLALAGCTAPTGGPKVSTSSPVGSPLLGTLPEPLICVGAEAPAAETEALQQALRDYEKGRVANPDRFSPLEGFLTVHPNSPWRASLKLNLGLICQQTGYASKALANFQDAWKLLRDASEPNARALGDRALGELSSTLCSLGRYEALEPLLRESKSRKLHGSATEWVTSAYEGLHRMQTCPGLTFRCGPLALSKICRRYAFGSKSMADKAEALIEQCHSTRRGTSLAQVAELAKRCQMGYQAAYRAPGSTVITPSVIHLKVGHFSAILEKVGDRFRVEDSTNLTSSLRITTACLDEESSGFCLVPAGPLPKGWRKISDAEAKTVWGRGTPADVDADSTATKDTRSFPCDCACGMSTWNVQALVSGLTLEDTPIAGSGAFSVPFSVTYAHREANQPAIFTYGNLGPKWSCNWLSIVTDKITTTGRAELYHSGGGTETFQFPNGSDTSVFGTLTPAVLKRVVTGGNTSFVYEMPDGSQKIYDRVVGDQYFMTKEIDQQGNQTTINFDSQMRIASVVDPIGRVLTLSYQLPQDPLKITQVTDPFGRSAQFAYTNGHLSSVTDVIGIISSYDYGSNDFIRALTTPYGVTTFAYADRTTDPSLSVEQRILTVTDPAGRNWRSEFRNLVPGILPYEDHLPTGILTRNDFLNSRNACAWTPEQLEGGVGVDYTKATLYHFLHSRDSDNIAGRIIESIKKPLQYRIWFNYPGQVRGPSYQTVGMSPLPSHIAAFMPDGTTQKLLFGYNSRGNVTAMYDLGFRLFTYTYAPNDIDLISVATGGQTLFQAGYDSNHNINSLIDSSGGSSAFTYSSRGLLLTATNPLNETTTYGYNGQANLVSVTSQMSAITTYSYDNAERIASATDSEGYTVTALYDQADRPTSVSFPDGTSETINYRLLDVADTTDRLGRKTLLTQDAVRRLKVVTDPNGGQTLLDYGLDEAPSSVTDPAGHQTLFFRDLQDRLTMKQYAGGASQVTTYESGTNRLHSVTDPLGHTKTFEYFLDNTLKNITYSGSTPPVSFQNDSFLPRPLSMTDGQGTTTYTYIPVGSPGANSLASVTGPLGDTAAFHYDIAGRMTGRTINGATETQTFDPLWRTTSTSNALDTFTMGYLGKTGQVTSVNSTLGPTMQYAYGTNMADRRLAQIKNLNRVGGAVISQFDFTTNSGGEINQIIESHGVSPATPTPTPTTTNTTTPTPTPTVTPPGDDDEDEDDEDDDDHGHHGHHGNGHHGDDDNGHGNDHHGNGGHKDKHRDKDKDDRHHGLIFSPDITRTGTTALVLTLWGALVLYTLAQPRTRRTLVAQIASLGLIGTLALNGCLVGTVDVGANTSVTYSFNYDNLSQLIGVNINSTPAATFSFDGAGNLLSLTAGNTTTGFTANNLNQRTSPGVNVYDAKGQTTDKDGRIFEWDDDGRMTAIVDGTHRSEFGFDGYGRRIKIAEFDNGVITSKKLYWWLGGQIVTEREGLTAGFPITKQYFGQGVIANGVKLWYTWDQLGSVRELIDSTGAVRADYRYSTYGERTKEAGDLDSDFGYAGLFHHGPSGLDLATYRTYDSAQGRWISRDPLGEGVDYNLYRYCGNNPISCVDPSGLDISLYYVPGSEPNYFWEARTGRHVFTTVTNPITGRTDRAEINVRPQDYGPGALTPEGVPAVLNYPDIDPEYIRDGILIKTFTTTRQQDLDYIDYLAWKKKNPGNFIFDKNNCARLLPDAFELLHFRHNIQPWMKFPKDLYDFFNLGKPDLGQGPLGTA